MTSNLFQVLLSANVTRNVSRGANLLPICFTLDCEPFHCTLKVISRWQSMERSVHTAAGLCCLVALSDPHLENWEQYQRLMAEENQRPSSDPPPRTTVFPPQSLRPHNPHSRPNKSPPRAPVSCSEHPEGPDWKGKTLQLPTFCSKRFSFSFYPFNISLLSITCHIINLIILKIHKNCISYFHPQRSIDSVSLSSSLFFLNTRENCFCTNYESGSNGAKCFLCRGSKICCRHHFGSPSCESCVTGSQLSCLISATCKKLWPFGHEYKGVCLHTRITESEPLRLRSV